MGRLRSSIFAALVLLSLAPPAARAEEPSPAAPAAQTAQAAPAAGVSIVDAWLDQAALRWRKHEELLARGDREGAMAAADEAAVFLRDEGIGRCPPLADAALAEARRASDPKAAIEAAVLARRFDPENGAASWLEARSRWRAGEGIGASLAPAVRAVGIRLTSFWNLLSMVVGVGGILILSPFAAFSAGAAAIFFAHAGRVAHEIEERLPLGWHAAWRRSVGWAIVLAPAAIQWLGAFALVAWAVVIVPAATRAERRLIAFFLLIAALVPPATGALWALGRAAGDLASRAAIEAAQRTARPGLEADLAALVAAQPREPLWRLMQARFVAARAPEEGMSALREAMVTAPTEPRLRVAMGNVFFRSGKRETAAVWYRQALDLDPKNVVAFFNLSRARAAELELKDSEDALAQARAASADELRRVERETPPEGVADPLVDPREAARRLAANEAIPAAKRALSPANPVTFAAVGALLAVLLLGLRGGVVSAQTCVHCGRAFCLRCAADERGAEACTPCQQLFTRREGLSPQARQQQARLVDRHIKRLAIGRIVVQAVWPGVALIHEGRIGIGLFEAWLWALCVAGALLPARLGPLDPAAPLWKPGLLFLVFGALLWILFQTPRWRPTAAGGRGGR